MEFQRETEKDEESEAEKDEGSETEKDEESESLLALLLDEMLEYLLVRKRMKEPWLWEPWMILQTLALELSAVYYEACPQLPPDSALAPVPVQGRCRREVRRGERLW
jgi:hypothetical protein